MGCVRCFIEYVTAESLIERESENGRVKQFGGRRKDRKELRRRERLLFLTTP